MFYAMTTRRSKFAFRLPLAVLMALGLVAVAQAVDTVKQRSADGSVKARTGKIKEVTKEAVVLELTPTTKTDTIPANVIDSVSYDPQPPEMNLLASAVRSGNLKNAVEQLKKLTGPDVTIDNPGVKEELAFYKMYVDAKVAMESGQLVDMKKAKDGLQAYLRTNLGWHYYEAVELLGTLCLAIADVEVEKAKSAWFRLAIDESYTRLAQAPWDETKIQAVISRAKAQYLNKEVDAALKSFDDALKLTAGKDDPKIASLALAAKVGKAEVTGDKNPADGIKLVQEIIAKADVEDSRVQAMSALAIARCYEKAGDTKEALLNNLKVDVLYFSQPNLHAEALYNLSRLWPKVNQPQRGKDAENTLRTRYPGSVWAARLAASGG
jgi:tetratricopeptide (TPR) repeat protein